MLFFSAGAAAFHLPGQGQGQKAGSFRRVKDLARAFCFECSSCEAENLIQMGQESGRLSKLVSASDSALLVRS